MKCFQKTSINLNGAFLVKETEWKRSQFKLPDEQVSTECGGGRTINGFSKHSQDKQYAVSRALREPGIQ